MGSARCLRTAAMIMSLTLAARSLAAQTDVTCVPVADRAQRTSGCFITAREELGTLSTALPIYWHIDTYNTLEAATAARQSGGTVVRSLDRIWLFTIAPQAWRPRDGRRMATIGPLPIVAASRHAAVYLEGIFQPGMMSGVHRHPGVEAWLTLEGAMCLETPEGRLDQKAGDSGVLVRDGVPMVLTGTGTGPRKSLVLILQDADLPRSLPAHDWTPMGLCAAEPK